MRIESWSPSTAEGASGRTDIDQIASPRFRLQIGIDEAVTMRVAAVTGGTRGIGRGISVALKIAGYKVPRSVSFVPELPHTGSDKLLKRELREPYWRGHKTRV